MAPARGLAALTLAFIVARAQPPTALRVINQANATISVRDDAGALVATLPPDAVGAYVPFNQSTNNFTIASPFATAAVSWASWDGESVRASLLVAMDPAAGLAGALLDDAAGPLPDSNRIDQCQLRVVNAYPSTVFVNWVSTACVGCLHPPAFQPNAVMQFASGPSMSDYAIVPCALPLSVQVTTADGVHVKAAIDVAAVQQGAYTLLVRPPPRALLTLLADAPPDGSPYTPLLVAAAVLVAAALAHRALGYALVAAGAV